MQIFVTNLPTELARRQSITTQLERMGLSYEMPPCTIGGDLTDAEIAKYCDASSLDRHASWLTRGAIGCTLTCHSIYKMILTRGLKCALYLEDDTCLPADLPALLDQIEAKVVDGEVLLLSYLGHKAIVLSTQNRMHLLKDYHALYPMEDAGLGGGSAFVVTPAAARKVLEFNTPIRFTPDCWDMYLQGGCITRLRCVYPMPVGAADYPSTLGYRKKLPSKVLVDLINRHRIPGLYQLLRYRRRAIRRRRQECVLTDEPSPVGLGYETGGAHRIPSSPAV